MGVYHKWILQPSIKKLPKSLMRIRIPSKKKLQSKSSYKHRGRSSVNKGLVLLFLLPSKTPFRLVSNPKDSNRKETIQRLGDKVGSSPYGSNPGRHPKPLYSKPLFPYISNTTDTIIHYFRRQRLRPQVTEDNHRYFDTVQFNNRTFIPFSKC